MRDTRPRSLVRAIRGPITLITLGVLLVTITSRFLIQRRGQ